MLIAASTLLAVVLLVAGVLFFINAEGDGLTLSIALGCCFGALLAAFFAGRYSV